MDSQIAPLWVLFWPPFSEWWLHRNGDEMEMKWMVRLHFCAGRFSYSYILLIIEAMNTVTYIMPHHLHTDSHLACCFLNHVFNGNMHSILHISDLYRQGKLLLSAVNVCRMWSWENHIWVWSCLHILLLQVSSLPFRHSNMRGCWQRHVMKTWKRLDDSTVLKGLLSKNLQIYDRDDISCGQQSTNRHLLYCSNFECHSHYKCKGSYCVPVRHVCNGVQDCPNGEEEGDCTGFKCSGLFWCPLEQLCLSFIDICDRITHCHSSGADELLCGLDENFICDTAFFKCHGYYCIRWRHVCNNVWDCPGGADENDQYCDRTSCPGQFKCHILEKHEQTICLSIDNVCDRIIDCKVGDDELFCFPAVPWCPINCTCFL